jgi:hypothetical protein
MHIRTLDLDGSLTGQNEFATQCRPATIPAQDWGPNIRLACSFGRFRLFGQVLAQRFGSDVDEEPAWTLCGSGDFHHVSLALLRRQAEPFNLLVLDNHPDWMRGVPFLHCGTWLYHAARLPLVQRVFHVGGDVDFDNYYRWMAPWPLLRSRKITVFPAVRSFRRGPWSRLVNQPVRTSRETPAGPERVAELVRPFRAELAHWPLYISLDKDVLPATEAIVNWDSGHLLLDEVRTLIAEFLGASCNRLASMDTVGDWSPLRLHGWLRWAMHLTEHPSLAVQADEAARRNAQVNLALLDLIQARGGLSAPPPTSLATSH